MYVQNYRNQLHASNLVMLRKYPSENIINGYKKNIFTESLKVAAVAVLEERGESLEGIKVRRKGTRVEFKDIKDDDKFVIEILNDESLSKALKARKLILNNYNPKQISKKLTVHLSLVYRERIKGSK